MLHAKCDDIIKGVQDALGADHGMELVTGGREAGFAVIELMRRNRRNVAPMNA